MFWNERAVYPGMRSACICISGHARDRVYIEHEILLNDFINTYVKARSNNGQVDFNYLEKFSVV